MKKIIKYGIVFLILIFIFNFLLFIGSLFPSKIIAQNVKESSETLSDEGDVYQFFEYLDIVNNNFTDALMINEAYSIDNTHPIHSYMTVRKNYNKEMTKNSIQDISEELTSINFDDYDPVGELEEFLNGDIDTSVNYARYWHGYLPILRTLLIFFNITEIRRILLIIFIILFIYLIKLIKEKIGTITAIIFAIALIMQGYFFVSYSLESTPIFIVMMTSSIILLKRIDKLKSLYLYIFIIACITNFVDYLTVPLITLAIPLLLYILYKQKNNKEIDYKEYILIIIKSSIIWLIGYSITWLSKWIIYDVIYKEGLIKSAIHQVIYRTKNSNSNTDVTIQDVLVTLIGKNLRYAIEALNVEILVIFVMIKRYKIKLKPASEYIKENIPIIIISAMPLVWYIVLTNHTVLHLRFTYRHMLIFLIGILICMKNIFIIEKKEKIKKSQK